MDNQKQMNDQDVVSIFSIQDKKNLSKVTKECARPASDEEVSFEEEMRRYKEMQKRLERERAKANKAVLRSYRIKS